MSAAETEGRLTLKGQEDDELRSELIEGNIKAIAHDTVAERIQREVNLF